ncbi:TMAO reductase system periplasmic protein TorT [Vibrio sp. SM6]|uniref:TMAO reductase system periplasmic protein TorT n=1 Tax=Vibrio agarilyticus TaxID=2726741 RepID=A0A7X8TRG8_9VIBR|nr:TMAO reductase system periplasmic protein TorT [Vibrio agarilyticus]NLS13399.1 TMAO reductase system periplasmic protein TorT [Vibrio agarilyticus]
MRNRLPPFFQHIHACLTQGTRVLWASIGAFSLLFSTTSLAEHKLCAIYPHLKDSYWISVNYGMVSEAKRQGVTLRVLEAGGYLNLEKQQEQLQLCQSWGADAILLGTVDPEAYRSSLGYWVKDTPVFSTVNPLWLNDEQKTHHKGQVGASWYQMGFETGEFLASQYPDTSDKVARVALLLGPKNSGGTKPVAQGFYDAIKNSNIDVVETLWADNDKELQRNLVQQVLEQNPIDYIVGSAVAIEAAISELRSANRENEIGLISIYLSHGVYRGLLRNKVEYAPSDQMVLQGRKAVQQAVAYLNQQTYSFDDKTKIIGLTPNNIDEIDVKESLSPSKFRPVFEVKANIQ